MYEGEVKAQVESRDVPEQIDRLGGLLDDLDKNIFALEEQLNSVLREGQDRETGDEKEKELVPLANLIRQRCLHVKSMIKHVDGLRRRLQI